MQISFTKMHGLGNDFVVINNLQKQFNLSKAHIQQLAHRNTGIGFDQLLLVEKPRNPLADFFYRIFNADGSEIAQCGNGARCFAHFVYKRRLTRKKTITVETIQGLLTLQIAVNGLVTVNMGIPKFEPSAVPFICEQAAELYHLKVGGNELKLTTLAIGNPHAVIHVEDITGIAIDDIGRALNCHPQFPEGVNVGFMQVLAPNNIRLRVYERGTGETLACGSGACAAVVAGRLLRLLGPEQVTVNFSLGSLQVHWQGKQQPVWLTGSAVNVFEGMIDIKD